jgi:hypothetical protein
MKKIALGLVAAATIFTAVPAMAQIGFYAGGPVGVGVGVGVPGPYYNCGYHPCARGYYDYYGGPGLAVGVGPGWQGHRYRHWHR